MPRKIPPTVFDFKAARKARGVSQHKAAELLHATQPSISRWEADGSMPAVYKMAWTLYWQLEDINNGNSRKLDRTKRAKGKTNDRATSASADNSRSVRRKDARSRTRAARGAASLRPRVQQSEQHVSTHSDKPDTTDAVQR